MGKLQELDHLIHSRIRLSIMSILISVKEADFNYLKETIGTTDGNLSTHLTKLEEGGYVLIKKGFVGKKPRTRFSITSLGRDAFQNYVQTIERYINPE